MIGDCSIRDCGDAATMQLMGRWSGPVMTVCARHAEVLRSYRAGRTRLVTRVWNPRHVRISKARVPVGWDTNGAVRAPSP